MVDWLCVDLVPSAPNSLSHLLTFESTDSLANAVLLDQRHAVLIRDLPDLNHYLSRATGYLIAS